MAILLSEARIFHPGMFDMPKSCKTIGFLFLLTFFFPFIYGCGSNENGQLSPYEPPVLLQNAVSSGADTVTWGTWKIRCTEESDDNPAEVQAIPLRTADIHVDVAGLLKPPKCVNCMDVEIVSIEESEWTLLVTLSNPTLHTAYDVRGIFPGVEGPKILNPSSYTGMFDIDGNSSTYNPYVVFETGNPFRAWEPMESHSQTFTFSKDSGEKFTDLIYVVAVSWPEPQDEIVELRNPHSTGPLLTDGMSPVNFNVEVLDWQDDVEYVIINLEPVNGGAYTQMDPIGDGIYQYYSYAAYGLTPGTAELLIAAKSLGSPRITYNYLTVEIKDPQPPKTIYSVYAGPVLLSGEAAPSGELDLSVVGKDNGTSSTIVNSSSTSIHAWNENYTQYSLFLSLVDPSGEDANFPVEPVSRITVTDPMNPYAPSTYSILQTNLDPDIWSDSTSPAILYRNILQLMDIEQMTIADFKLTADNPDTSDLDVILRPLDVSAGVNGNRHGYALWIPDTGSNMLFYPYVALVRYEPPYNDGTNLYDRLIGGVQKGSGPGKIDTDNANGLAIWDGAGDSNIFVAISEGGSISEVEIFNADYVNNPEELFNPVATITGLPGEPLDVAILPVADYGFESENWIVILTSVKTIETYTFSGDFVVSFYEPDLFPGTPKHIDTDTKNLRIHVLTTGPYSTVIEYDKN
ncbi:MAG TPA: hypothetical protein ENN67_01160 [Firmicutes bacterium]|nr:hypothetical protein [Bacillota bacterium]